MSDLVILATIKDAKGQELDTVEIPIEGLIPSKSRTMVGTLKPEDAPEEEPGRKLTTFSFNKLAEDDPELQLQWTSGVEVEMDTEEFTNAEIDILELRAVPDDEAASVVSSG
jgi:hypothetical protein